MCDLLGIPRVAPFFLRRAYPRSLNGAILNSLAKASLNDLILGKLARARRDSQLDLPYVARHAYDNYVRIF